MVDPFVSEKLLKVFRDIFSTVVASETLDLLIEAIFHIGDVPLNGFRGVRLLLKKVNSGETGKVIYEGNVVIVSSK
jgi:hypothetical protein